MQLTRNMKHMTLVLTTFLISLLSHQIASAAVYCMSQCEKKQQTDLYQEIIIVKKGDSLYTAQQHGAGYLGFYGGDDIDGHGINFSIWDNKQGDRNFVVEGPDARIGGSVERFGNEGTGAKTRTFLKWEFGVYYKTYIKVEHVHGGTLWSGWAGRLDQPEWYLLGRIFVPKSRQWTGNGGIFLETLTDHEGTTKRENGIRLGWSRDAKGWGPHTGFTWSCQEKHLSRANGYQAEDNSVRLTFAKDNKSEWHPKTRYSWPAKGRDDQEPLKPSPAVAPETMPAFTGEIVDVSACPIENSISKKDWKLIYVSSEETKSEKAPATNAFDGNSSTYWHTAWEGGKLPNDIQIDLGTEYDIDAFGYQAREGGSLNGTIAKYEFYVSNDKKDWGKPVASGTFSTIAGIGQYIGFTATKGRYVRVVALSEVNGRPYTSAAEFFVYKKAE